jgi:hypothetical protein
MAYSADQEIEMAFPGLGFVTKLKANTAVQYYKGSLVNIVGGYAAKAADSVNHAFGGIVKEAKLGSTVAPYVDLEIIRSTVAWLPMSGAAVTDVGKAAYATADDAVTTTAATNVKPCGKVVDWKTGFVLVDMSDRTISA